MRLGVVIAVALSVLGCVLGLLSFVVCSSWYAEDELRDLFDADDAAFVALIGTAALLCLLGVIIVLLRRRSRLWLPLVVVALVVAMQVTGAGARGVCLSLPGILQGGHWVMRAE